jgi:site-specific DNA recombinase
MKDLIYSLYCRKSSESKERQALSIADQRAECEEYAQNLKIFVDKDLIFEESKSAFKPNNRVQFSKLLQLIELGRVNSILTWKPDRLSRNPEEGGKILQLLQDGVLKEIRTATGEIYTQDSDHLILQIHFGMANQYSRLLSQNVKRGMKRKCMRKEYPRSGPLGYETVGEPGSKNIVPHPVEAPAIQELFELASKEIYSLGYLMKWISEKKKLKTKRGNKISKSHIYAILTTPTYYGYFTYAGELHEGSYQPLISKRLFDKVQKSLNNRSKSKVNTWKPYLNGIITCGECGCAITTTVKKKYYPQTERTAEYRYNHCTHRKGNCTQPALSAKELERQLIDSISKIQINKEVWELGTKLLKAKYANQTKENDAQIQSLQASLRGVQHKKRKLIFMRAEEEISKDEFVDQKALLLNEQARFQSLINDLSDTSNSWLERAEEFFDTAFHVRDILKDGSLEEKRMLIITVGQNFLLKDNLLTFQMKKPFDILLKPEMRTNVMPDLDSNQD